MAFPAEAAEPVEEPQTVDALTTPQKLTTTSLSGKRGGVQRSVGRKGSLGRKAAIKKKKAIATVSDNKSPLRIAPDPARRSSPGDDAKAAISAEVTEASVASQMNRARKASVTYRKSIAKKHWGSLATITAKKAAKVDELLLSIEAEKMLGGIESWSLNLFTLEMVSGGRPLVAIGLRAIENLGLYDKLPINPLMCAKFFSAVEDGYGKYPDILYHNNLHGTDVLHTTYVLLQNPALEGIFSDLEVFAALLAAAAHDMGHPGVNNSFLNTTSHNYALVYNDISTLENYHASTVFKLMARQGFNVLEGFPKEDAKVIRKLMVDMILGTDMVKHLDHLQQFRECMMERVEHVDEASLAAQKTKAEEGGFRFHPNDHDGLHDGPPPPMSDKHRVVVLNSIVHLADLSGPTKPWERSKLWAARVLKEFFNQGKKELELGIPVEPLNDGTKVNVAKGQKGFIGYVVAPLWEIWEDMVLAGKHEEVKCEPIEMMHVNLNKWQEMIDQGDVSGNAFVEETLGKDDWFRQEQVGARASARRLSSADNQIAEQAALMVQLQTAPGSPKVARRARRRSSMRIQGMHTHTNEAGGASGGAGGGGGGGNAEEDREDAAAAEAGISMVEIAAAAVAEMEAEVNAEADTERNTAKGRTPPDVELGRRRSSNTVRVLPAPPAAADASPQKQRRGSRQLPVVPIDVSPKDETEA